MIRRFNKFK